MPVDRSLVDPDPVAQVLADLADAARANVAEWESVLSRIDAALEKRRAGQNYSDMQIDPDGGTIIEVLSRNQERLNDAGARFRRVMARQLVLEGWSQSQVAAAFHVSRQRIAALLIED